MEENLPSGGCHVMNVALLTSTGSGAQCSSSKQLFVKYGDDCPLHPHVVFSRWSGTFSIEAPGDTIITLRYVTLVPLKEYCPQGTEGERLSALAPLDPESIVERADGEVYVKREETEVLSVSRYYRSSIMYVVISKVDRAPLRVENRTAYTVYVSQLNVDSSTAITVYPHLTVPFAWESVAAPPTMVLCASNGGGTKSAPIYIDLTPSNNMTAEDQVRCFQELTIAGEGKGDGERILFVGVRGVPGVSYSVSVTEEPICGTNQSLSIPPSSFHLKLRSFFVLVSGIEYADLLLLSIQKPSLTYELATVAASENGTLTSPREVLSMCARFQTVQLDDERPRWGEKVVMQLTNSTDTAVRLERQMLHDSDSAIMYFPRVHVAVAPIELHMEDSFLYDLMAYVEAIRAIWKGSVEMETPPVAGSRAFTWQREAVNLASLPIQNTANTTTRTRRVDWRRRRLVIRHLILEKCLVSVSLYRSPGSEKDPIRQHLGFISVLIRSTQNARLDWPRLEQRSIQGTMGLLADTYFARYKARLMDQILSFVNIVGFDTVRGLVSDLFTGPRESLQGKNRRRVGLRATAGFCKDNSSVPSGIGFPIASSHTTSAAASASRRVLVNHTFVCVDEVARKMNWRTFERVATVEETIQFGDLAIHRALQHAIPAANYVSDSTAARHSVGTVATGAIPSSSEHCQKCVRCSLVETLRRDRLREGQEGLPHPREGTITWPEYLHHSSWTEFVQRCSKEEVMKYRGTMKDTTVGEPRNIRWLSGGRTQ